MTTFKVSAVIKVDPDSTMTFSRPAEYSVPGVISTTITHEPTDPSILMVKFEIQANDTPEATFLAETELLKIISIISWRRNMVIKDYKVMHLSYTKESGSHQTIAIHDIVRMTDHVSLSVGLGELGVATLSSQLAEGINPEHEDILMMWREAISEPSKPLQFLLYYRLLEYVAKGTPGGADGYIKKAEPGVPLEKDSRNGDISIYAYLRDNIHPKNPNFPFAKIEEYLPPLSTLVREAIKEKYPDLV